MRRVHYADVSSAARALLGVCAEDRYELCMGMIRRAARADAFRRQTGRAHRRWGTGSLMEVARQWPMGPEPGFDDADYCAAMGIVLECLRQRALSQRHSSRSGSQPDQA